ncbi:MAG TPA: arylsulfatase [Bacteroidales bacterium]|nr:arylsulfatase [Bacteroidales bacterium]
MKKLILYFAGIGSMITCQSQNLNTTKSNRPNVIFIYADDLGRGLLGTYGQKIIKTPNIDKIAQEGIRFENAYGCMLSAPARASLLTGYHDCHGDKWKISRGGIYSTITKGENTFEEIQKKLNDQYGVEDENEIYLAEVFKRAGYITGEVGKLEWGFAATDRQMRRHGWDYYYGYLDHVRCHGYYPPFLIEDGKMVMIEGNTRADCGKSKELETQSAFIERWNMEGKKTYSQNLFIEKILRFIRENKSRPFFLYHPTQIPHGPVAIPKVHPDFVNDVRLTQIEKEYASMVKMLDDQVGVILSELKKLGLEENTMIIFSSDNGHEIYYAQKGRIEKPYKNMITGKLFNNISDKFYSQIGGDVFDGNNGMAGLKRSNWEGGVREPLFIRWKGKIKAGVISTRLVTNYDFLSTMADLVNVQLPVKKDGISYLPELMGKKSKEHPYVVYSSYMGPALVTRDGWKLRYFAPQKIYQLYYLPNDYREKNNLISQQAQKAEQLKKLLITACEGNLDNGWFKDDKNIMQALY